MILELQRPELQRHLDPRLPIRQLMGSVALFPKLTPRPNGARHTEKVQSVLHFLRQTELLTNAYLGYGKIFGHVGGKDSPEKLEAEIRRGLNLVGEIMAEAQMSHATWRQGDQHFSGNLQGMHYQFYPESSCALLFIGPPDPGRPDTTNYIPLDQLTSFCGVPISTHQPRAAT